MSIEGVTKYLDYFHRLFARCADLPAEQAHYLLYAVFSKAAEMEKEIYQNVKARKA